MRGLPGAWGLRSIRIPVRKEVTFWLLRRLLRNHSRESLRCFKFLLKQTSHEWCWCCCLLQYKTITSTGAEGEWVVGIFFQIKTFNAFYFKREEREDGQKMQVLSKFDQQSQQRSGRRVADKVILSGGAGEWFISLCQKEMLILRLSPASFLSSWSHFHRPVSTSCPPRPSLTDDSPSQTHQSDGSAAADSTIHW